MAELAVQAVLDGGKVVLAAAAALGDSFVNTGVQRLRVKNNAVGVVNVKVLGGARACSMGVAGSPAHDRSFPIPAGETWDFKPFNTERYNDGNNKVQLTYPDGHADLTLGAYTLG